MSDTTFTTLGPSGFEMRHYQETAVESAIKWLYGDGNPSGIIQLATGCGKTPMAGELIRRCIDRGLGHRFLFLAHRDELITQAVDVLNDSGLAAGREQGSLKADALFPAQVVVSTVQTMSRRLDQWPADEFDMIIQDEAHRGAGATFQAIYDHFSSAKLLGITATIDRADRKRLDRFTEVIYRYSLWDAIHDEQGPFLTPLKFIRVNVGADLRSCRTIGKKGDFNQGDLSTAIQPHIEVFSNAIAKEIAARKSMVFMPCVASATAMAGALNQLGIRSRWVSGDHPDRKEIVKEYKKGAFQVIVNCDMLGEGFDDAATECVILKPTRSRIAFAQMVGRATRLHADKEFARIIDFNHTTDLDLIGPGSLAELPESTAKEVEKIVKEEGEVNLWEAVERAKAEVKRREELQVSVAHLDLQYRRVEVDPFVMAKNLGVKVSMKNFGAQATPMQVAALKKFKVPNPESMSKEQASRLLSQLIERSRADLATIRQVNLLIQMGVKPHTARNFSVREASEAIDKLMRRA